MDTFMDKLAQKFTAQEIIKANSQAEAAELAVLREKAAKYEAILEELKIAGAKNAETIEKAEANAQKTEELIAAGLSKIEEIQNDKALAEELKNIMQELKETQNDAFEQLTDHVHKENVKVYRNVQAVIVEELAKQNEFFGKKAASVSGKSTAILIMTIFCLLTACAGVAFQVLLYLQII